MTEPFFKITTLGIPFAGNQNYTIILDKDLKFKLIPNFRSSAFPNCYLTVIENYKDEPTPITEDLQEIFDIGSEKHWAEYVLNQGARRVTDQETDIRIMHASYNFTVSGHRDVLEHDFQGEYFNDFKTTTREDHYPDKNFNDMINYSDGFIWFLIKGVEEDYKKQLSVYSYLHYIESGDYVNRGVITKLDKYHPRNRLSLEGELYPLEKTRNMILTYPPIHYILGKITYEQLVEYCKKQMAKFVKGSGANKKCWKCTNCALAELGCEVKIAIEK